uniref:Uncharacterized protein n=1 Tax=Anopheles coluzzii TaxID=1518534 RepID=A0A8W7P5Z0_ANOCL
MRSNVSRCDGYTARSSRFPCIRRLLNACPIETLALLQGATSPDGWTREREAVGGVDKKAISFPFAIPVFRRAESGKIAYWIPAMEAHDESRRSLGPEKKSFEWYEMPSTPSTVAVTTQENEAEKS